MKAMTKADLLREAKEELARERAAARRVAAALRRDARHDYLDRVEAIRSAAARGVALEPIWG